MKRRLAGSVTLFYAGILLMLISLLGALLESVRVHTANSMVSDSVYLALQNSLAGYQRELWEDYHLFFLDVRECGGIDAIREELQENLDLSWQSPPGMGDDWMGVKCRVQQVSLERSMIAFGGEELKEQIRSYMQYRGTAAMVEYLAEQLGVMSGIREGESLLERKVELERATAETEKSRIQVLMELEEMETGWQQVEEAMNRIKEKSEAVETDGPDILAEMDEIYRVSGELQRQNDSVSTLCRKYEGQYQSVLVQRADYRNWLNQQREVLEESAWGILWSDLEDLERGREKEAHYMRSVSGKVAGNRQILQRMKLLCQTEPEDSEGMAAQLMSLAGSYQSQLLPDDYQLPSGEGEQESPFVKLHRYLSESVLALVMPAGQQVSDRSIQMSSWWEDILRDTEKSKQEESIEDEAENAMLGVIYEQEHFGNYRQERADTALLYEREYLLVGKETDRMNLAGTVEQLLLIRTVTDFLQILTEADRVAEAGRLAMAIAGVSGTSALIPVLRTGILLLWSVEDAVEEVRGLLSGERVAVCGWKQLPALSYEEYLSLLLVLEREKRYERMAQLIESDIQLRYQSEYQASDSMASIRMNTETIIVPKFFGGRYWKQKEEWYLSYAR